MSIRLTILCILALAFGYCVTADAQTVQPQYVRPSKGLDVGVFPLAGGSPVIAANSIGAYTSAIYDMTAFSEAQLAVSYADSSIGAQTRAWTTSQFGRYIRIIVEWENRNTRNYKFLRYIVQSSANTTSSNFRRIDAPGDLTIITGNPQASLTSQSLVMTPIPFQTLSYTRPSKGESLLVFRGALNSAVGDYTSPVFSWNEFAAASVTVTSSNTDACRYWLRFTIFGSYSEDGIDAQELPIRNARRTVSGSSSYAINIATPYVYFKVSEFNNGSGLTNCTDYTVNVTPLPFVVPPDQYSSTGVTFGDPTIAVGGSYTITADPQRPFVRIQATSTVGLRCTFGPTSTVYPIELVGSSSVVEPGISKGDGASFEIRGLEQDIRCFCLSTTAACSIGFVQY